MPPVAPSFKDAVDFQSVFEASQDIYALVAPNPPDFTVLAVSDGHVQASMRPREVIIGRGFFEVYPQGSEASEGPESLQAAFERLLRDKEPNKIGTFRYDIPDPDNPEHFHERYWTPQNFPIFGADGEVRYILHRVEEVTDHVLRDRYRPEREASAQGPSRRILIAEADAERRGYLQGLFERRWEVDTVSTVEEALEAVRSSTPDLLFSGLDFPDQSGEGLVKTLRQRPENRDVPVIVTLGRTNPVRFQAAMEAGADEVVSGQGSPRELVARVEAQLNAAALHRNMSAQAQKRHHKLLMQAPIAAALLEGPDHVYALSNPAYDTLVGHRPLLGRSVRKAFPELAESGLFEELDRVYTTGKPFFGNEVPVPMRFSPDAEPTTKYLSFTYLPFRGLEGAVEGIAVFAHDLTEAVAERRAKVRKRGRQEAVARIGERALWNPPLKELFDEVSRELATQLDVDLTKVLEWHPEEGYLLLQSGIGWPEGQVGSATEPDRYGSPGGYTLLSEEPVFITDLASDGRFTVSQLLTDHGAVSGITVVIRGAQRPYGVLAAFTKVPHTFTAEEVSFLQALANILAASIQRAYTEERLRHSEAQFREMADGLPIVVWMHDAEGNQELANQALCDFCGITREEISWEGLQNLLYPEDAGAYMEAFSQSLREQRPFHAEVRAQRADGQWRLMESLGQPRFSDTGEFQGLVGACVDITEQRAAEEDLREADQRKKEFLALLGHELRNPLTPIANVAQLLQLQKGTIDRNQLDQVAEVLDRQSAHLTRIVNDLLDLSRLERDMLALEREQVNLRELVHQAVESIPALLDPEGHPVRVALPESPLMVDGDWVRLTQIVTNLLDNAVKHTPEKPEIRVEAEKEDDQVTVRMIDQGAGIDPAFLPHLFESFERGPDRETQNMGLGLGLPLVKRLVELHGGTVEAYSPGVGRGSTFVVRLPAQAPTETEDPEGATVDITDWGSVLLVEDNEDVARSLRFLLEGLDQEVQWAPSGEAGIEAAINHRPSLVLIDIGLPDMNGFQVAENLRENLGAIPLVVLSGHPESEFAEERTGVFDEWLLKPPTLEDLQQTLALRKPA